MNVPFLLLKLERTCIKTSNFLANITDLACKTWLPKEAIVALVIGFLRKDVAVGMLMPLSLSAKQLFIAATLLAISFPCVATFIILWKELGLKDLIKAALIMIIVSIIVGGLLNFAILR